jgi:cyclohexanecarboxyl-CoA dehydrogenase
MLDFSFTSAQQEYRGQLRAFVLAELLPLYRHWDRTSEYPYEQIRKVLRFSEDFWRGREQERDLIVAGITAEEVARGDFNCVLPSVGPAVTREFLAEAPEHLKQRWLPLLRTGEKVIGLCLTEAGAGSDMGSIQTSAVRRGDLYVLNGEKNSVSFLNADVFFIFARTDPSLPDWRGLSAFLVPRETRGLSFEAYDDMGCRAVPRGIVRIENAEVPVDSMVGRPGGAFPMIRRFFDINRAIIGLKCVGAAQQTLDETVEYTRQRVQFDQPLASFQGVAFPIAEAATRLELTRWLSYRVLWMRQRGIDCSREGAMVKWWAPETAVDVIHQCLILHGHYGYTKGLPIEQRLRDVIGWQIGDGTPQIQKLIIARSLYGRGLSPR